MMLKKLFVILSKIWKTGICVVSIINGSFTASESFTYSTSQNIVWLCMQVCLTAFMLASFLTENCKFILLIIDDWRKYAIILCAFLTTLLVIRCSLTASLTSLNIARQISFIREIDSKLNLFVGFWGISKTHGQLIIYISLINKNTG